MSIVRSSRPSGNFTIVQNEIFKGSHLSFAGMGFLCFLLSKPENWSISIPACAKVTQGSRRASGRDAIYALLDELIAAGYIDRQDVRDGSGRRSGVRYVVYDAPIGSKEKPYYGPREKDAPEQVEQETAAPIPAEPFLANTDALIRTDIKQGLKENNNPLSPPRGKATKGTRLPDDWEPTEEMIQFAYSLSLPWRSVAESFRDYWIAVPGAKGVKLDWAATWRNWCRSEAKRGNRGQSQQTRAQRVRDAWAGVPDIEGV